MIKTDNKNRISITIGTEADCDVNEIIKGRVEKAIQEEVNKCSKEYYRSINATITLNLN